MKDSTTFSEMVKWALQWRSERDPGPLENVEEAGSDGVCWFPGWEPGGIKRVASETQADILQWSGETWWESLILPQAAVGTEEKGERRVHDRRRGANVAALCSDWRHRHQGQRGAPRALLCPARGFWLLESPLAAPLLSWPFEYGCTLGFLLRSLGPSGSPSLRASSFTPTSAVSHHLCVTKAPQPRLSPEHSPVA